MRPGALALKRPLRDSPIFNAGRHLPVGEAEAEPLRRERGRSARHCPAVAGAHSREAPRQRPVRMNQLGHRCDCAKSVARARDALIKKTFPQTACDEIEVGPGVPGPSAERTRKPLANLIQFLLSRCQQGSGLRPAASR